MRSAASAGFWLVAASLCGLIPGSLPPSDRADLLIRHATLIDGSGAVPVVGDLAVRDGRIVRVGRSAGLEASVTIDATGLAVAPGFIDVHTHADELAVHPRAENFVRMGVTTVVAGNCGASPVDIANALRQIETAGASVNFATLVGHGSVRAAVMGTEHRSPTHDELARMRGLVTRAMEAGALGLSSGLEYVPGTYASRDELVALAREAARFGGIYASHMRNEGTAVEQAVAETIAVGEAAACPVQVSHLKIDSPSAWGRSTQVLQQMAAARRRGVDVRADLYAYSASGTGLGIRFPAWALEGGQARIEARLADETTWRQIKAEMKRTLAARGFKDLSFAVVAAYSRDRSFHGQSLAQIAARGGDSSLDAQLEVAREMLRAGGAQMVYHSMSDTDLVRIMRDRSVAIASDASLITFGDGMPHPRNYGNAARVLAHYVRARGVLTLQEAVRKMTSLPAEHFRLTGRGRLAEGHVADLVVFDPKTVDAPASFAEPHRYATGIPYVLVGGTFVVRDGVHTGARPGRVLRRAPAAEARQGLRSD